MAKKPAPGWGVRAKWWAVGPYWVVQTAVAMVGAPLLEGEIRSLSDVAGVFTDGFYAPAGVAVAAGLIFFQLVFLWPVRRPGMAQTSGWPLHVSLAVAGAAAAALFVGLLWGAAAGLTLLGDDNAETWLTEWGWLAMLALGWAVATPLLMAFCRRGARETVLGRVASRLFLGTIIEVALLIPLDVMVRRRSGCYCWQGSYYALLICAGVGMFALGPAIWLPLLARRRKRWYAGRCDACAYDMSGTPEAERCPECGAGWRTDEKR